MAFFLSCRSLSEQSEFDKQCPTLQPPVKFAMSVGAQLCKSNSCLKHFSCSLGQRRVRLTDHESIRGASTIPAATEVTLRCVQETDDRGASLGDGTNETTADGLRQQHATFSTVMTATGALELRILCSSALNDDVTSVVHFRAGH